MTIGLAPRGGERLIAAVALWAETALVGLGSILYVTLGIVGDGDDRRLSFGLAGLAAVAAIGLGMLARGVAAARRWASSPAITWQVLQGFVGAYAISVGYVPLGVVALVLAVVALVGAGIVPGDGADAQASPSATPTVSATPQVSVTADAESDESQRKVVENPAADVPDASVPSTPLRRAAMAPSLVDDPGVAAGTLRAGSRVVVVHSAAETARAVKDYVPWRERHVAAEQPYELVVAAGVADAADAMRGAFPRTRDQVTAAGARGDLLDGEAPLAGAGDAVEVTTVPGDQLEVPGGFFGMDVSTFADTEDAWVDLTLDVSGLAEAYGADALSRMRLMLFPACALTTPGDPACLTGTPLEVSMDSDGRLTATVPAHPLASGGSGGTAPGASRLMQSATASGSTIVAVGSESGQSGTFAATDLTARGD